MTEAVGTFSPTFRCIIYGSGIAGSLALYRMVQDRTMSTPYEVEFFKISGFLVLCSQAAAAVYASVMVMFGRNGTPLRAQAPIWKYMVVSLSSFAAVYCQYAALAHVSLLVQTLSRSFQMLPVMFWSIALSGKMFGLRDWTMAAFITGGVFLLLLAGSTRAFGFDKIDVNCTRYGASLLLGFLFCTGLTSTMQEKLFQEHQTSKYNQMLWVNLFSAVFSILALYREDTLFQALSFCSAHPTFVGHVMGLSAASVTGQWFIYSQVEEFGALVFATTMTARQVDVITLLSFLQYENVVQVGNIVAVLQVLALAIIFGVLFGKSVMGCRQRRGSKGERIPLIGKQGANTNPYVSNGGWVPLSGYQCDTMLGSWQGKSGMQYRMCETAAYADSMKQEVRLPVKEEVKVKPPKKVVEDDDDWLDEEELTGGWQDEGRDCWTCSDKEWIQVLEDSSPSSSSSLPKVQEQTEKTFVRAKQEQIPMMPTPGLEQLKPTDFIAQTCSEAPGVDTPMSTGSTSTCCSTSDEGDGEQQPVLFGRTLSEDVSSVESEFDQSTVSPRGVYKEEDLPDMSFEKGAVSHQHQAGRWECYSDPATGRSWWWNPDTEQATFENPFAAAGC